MLNGKYNKASVPYFIVVSCAQRKERESALCQTLLTMVKRSDNTLSPVPRYFLVPSTFQAAAKQSIN